MTITVHPDRHQKVHANPDIRHIILNLWTGRMSAHVPGHITSVLTVAATPGLVPPHVRHRHTPIDEHHPDPAKINDVVTWVMNQIHSERVVLIRSEDGTHRPATIVALALMRMGARAGDAIRCLGQAGCKPLPLDFLDLLAAEEAQTYG